MKLLCKVCDHQTSQTNTAYLVSIFASCEKKKINLSQRCLIHLLLDYHLDAVLVWLLCLKVRSLSSWVIFLCLCLLKQIDIHFKILTMLSEKFHKGRSNANEVKEQQHYSISAPLNLSIS